MAAHPDVERFRRASDARNQASFDAAALDTINGLFSDNVIWFGAATGVSDGAWGKERVVSTWNNISHKHGLHVETSAVYADGLHSVVVVNITNPGTGARKVRQLNVFEMDEKSGTATQIWSTPTDTQVVNAFATGLAIPEHRNLARFSLAEESRDRWTFEPQDITAIEAFLRPDVIWQAAGNSQWKEGVKTRVEVFKWYRLFKQSTNNTIKMDVHERFAGDQWACTLVTISAQNPAHPERHMAMPEVNLFHLDVEGRCFEYWGIPDDQEAMDAFWAP